MEYSKHNSEKQQLLQNENQEDNESSVNYSTEHIDVKTDSTPENRGLVIAKLPVVCILGTELCERLTFFSITGNFVIFCTNVLKFSSATAVTANLIFVGICFFIPAFSGWLADALLGKYRLIFISGVLFILGLTLLPIVALDYVYLFGKEVLSLNVKTSLFFIGILLIAFGTGGLKSNVSIFGAEQVQQEGIQSVTSFFNWFYWFVNVGGFIAFSCVVYVQQEISFAIGYMIPLVSMIAAVIFFFIPHKSYIHSPPRGLFPAEQS